MLDHDYGFDGALFVGYDLGSFRIEAEVAYKRARIDDIEAAIQLPGTPSLGGVGPGGVIQPDVYPGAGCTSALSFMVNGLLDFGDDDGISGFVGGGVGTLASTTTTSVRSPIRAPSSTIPTRVSRGRSSPAFARRSPTIST